MFIVLDTDDKRWDEYVNRFPKEKIDIYYYSDYYKLYEANNEGIGKIFIYEKYEKIALYPFLLREITGYDLDRKYYDIETAYGYGGPLANCYEEEFLSEFEESFLKYCKEQDIVAEFIRFNCLFNNHNIFKKNINVSFNRNTVLVDLTKDIEGIWNNQISSKNRNMIKKAIKSNLHINFDKNIGSFKSIYESTMNKVNASRYYYFSDSYYEFLCNINSININILYDNVIISSAIFLYDKNFIHYHLSGSIQEYLNYSPNNLMLWEIIKYAKNSGFKFLHLGGGKTSDIKDSLFKFKRAFSNNILEFYVGTRIHNNDVYEKLIDLWSKKNLDKEAKFFLQYRME